MGLRRLIRELREAASEHGHMKMISGIDELSDLIEELRRAEPGQRKPDPERIKILLSLLDYGEAVKSARKFR